MCKPALRRVYKWIGWLFAAPLILIAGYLLAAFGLLLVPANRDAPVAHSVDAYIVSNGVHTDFVFPARSTQMDWTNVFAAEHFTAMPAALDFIAIGWGDREFYLNTPNWSDLTAGRAFNALLGRDRSLLHVEYLSAAELQTDVYRLPLSQAQYASLIHYVLDTTRRDTSGGVNVTDAHYGRHDAFFEANGSYHLFNTCNTWIGRGLLKAGVKVSRWTPLDANVLWYLTPR
ncbi:TIGR02117 family protein [Dyella tabacisoli]|uniref:TIGR02117 family protein n=1 Tax=Dyella tabacisoli TaxID=2282381 RepID=A0A369UMW7_9GAMM|nr:TIGR02117 family protein [Dyella tabacisoli]RDD81068.1 TIGR02117 family protein [Dyella tabacisoli]